MSDIQDDVLLPEVPEEGQAQDEKGNQNMKPRDITHEMQESYLDYAMSVIISRALPDIRDGMKPVQRRILYTMHAMNMSAGSKYKKSARVVGEVMGKYHPHGDSSIYDTMVRLAQPFSMRYPLVDGQGNFGSIDGDPAAAQRYTEVRMTKIADEMVADLEKETVPFRPNYDGSEEEPIVLPGRFPNLLVNGNMGIAVGMATNMPPNNLGEVIDAVCMMLDNPEASIDDIMDYIQGPDFPTYGMIYDREQIKTAYATGRGSIVMRAKANIEETKSGRARIVVTELPYQVNKASLVEKIAMLVRDKKIVGVHDMGDESNKEGIRVVIELKRDAQPKHILNQLFQMTPMQSTFGVNLISLVDGIQPQLLNIKDLLEHFIAHRRIVIRKRTMYELKQAEDRYHILSGLKIALDNIDEVIRIIRAAATQEQAKLDLIGNFKLSERQADAILAMQLRRLAGLERKKIEDEMKELELLIAHLQSILADETLITEIIRKESLEMKDKYADPRRTVVITPQLGKFKLTDTIPNEEVVVTLTRENYIKRLPLSTFHSQKRGGKGVVGMATKDEDEIHLIVGTMTHNQLLFFTNTGRVFKLPVFEIDQASRQSKGQAIVNLLNLRPDEKVVNILDLADKKDVKYLFMSTKLGTVKKTELEDFKNIMTKGIIAIKIKEDDELLWVKATTGEEEIMIITQNGQSIRFAETDVRSMGRASSGVRGIKLKGKDHVVEMDTVSGDNGMVLITTEKGMGKQTPLAEYRLQSRGGSGIKTAMITPRTGGILGARVLPNDFEGDLLLISSNGQMLRMSLKDMPKRGRVTQGVFLMRFKVAKDIVASMSIVSKAEEVVDEVELIEE